MNDSAGYAVFFFPPALEALGDAIKPYLQDGPAGPHVPCREIDTAGAFIELTLEGRAPDGREVALELMVPGNMVRMIVSAHSDGEFGFYDRSKPMAAPVLPASPAEPAVADAPPQDAKPAT
ncbi:hypothetical protein [Thermomonas sp. HDW16]|uniref:hypothetical protein n=1 Tax=Thermomonas sp. HDW16 TaxID=2714945 RepID=UPI0014073A89|nr:hypothetical protein [Thermomonas sp. HDW16]QIL20090.1 hypothetical protein G7079_04705 [Thermomonas sp. HDW16]